RSPLRWIGAGTIAAADGAGAWLVGIDGEGHLWRLRGRASFEPVSDRFGLERAAVTAVALLGPTGSAFALKDEIAIADGAKVTRYETGRLMSFAGGGGHVVFGGQPLRVVDAWTKSVRAFAMD